jgi:hypothetical protein
LGRGVAVKTIPKMEVLPFLSPKPASEIVEMMLVFHLVGYHDHGIQI